MNVILDLMLIGIDKLTNIHKTKFIMTYSLL